MRHLRRLPRWLVLAFAVMAVGSYSALAGDSTVSVQDAPVAGSQRTNDGVNGRQSVQQQEVQRTEEGKGADKVAQAIADEFGVSKDEVLARHNEGIGFGALFKLYKLARAKGIGVDELLATIPTNANGEREFGFGQLRKGLTEEQRRVYEAGPKNLGKLVSGVSKKQGKPNTANNDSGADEVGASGRVPPGQARKAAKQAAKH
jgi:hypothetical protein